MLAVAGLLAILVATASGAAFGLAPPGVTREQLSGSSMKTISKSGIPYRPDADPGPQPLVDALRMRRPGGKLLNLDRMLLNSPPFAQGWNAMFAAIRGDLSLSNRENLVHASDSIESAEREIKLWFPDLA